MQNNIKNAIRWIKQQDIRGCITGSCLLEYFEDQDIDVFVYDEKSLNKLLFAMYHDDMFQLLDPVEKWKFEKYINTNGELFGKYSLLTIKFMYNTCIPVNIILKENCTNALGVVSSFDMDIICIAYDIETKQTLDLSNSSTITKVTSWNTWNTNYYKPEIWKAGKLLRQVERCFKYYKRGYNTDAVINKYIEIIDYIQSIESIFKSKHYNEQLEITKQNTKIIKSICEIWLETHELTDDEHNLIKTKLRQI